MEEKVLKLRCVKLSVAWNGGGIKEERELSSEEASDVLRNSFMRAGNVKVSEGPAGYTIRDNDTVTSLTPVYSD